MPVENGSSIGSVKPVKSGCTFCEPETAIRPHFADLGKERLDLVPLVESDNLVILPDMLPADPEGKHMLMVPKAHGYSFAALPQSVGDEVGMTLRKTEAVVGTQLAFFEHGSVNDGAKVQSIYHQHGHLCATGGYDIVRYMADVLDRLHITYQLVWAFDRSPVFNLKQVFQNAGYLYVQQGMNGLIAHDPEDRFPSQITQQSMSRLLSNRELNWKQIPSNIELACISVQRVANLIETCKR